MEYNLYEISTGTLAAIAGTALAGVVLAVALHRRVGMATERAVWTALASVSAVAVLLITLAPSGRGGTYVCELTFEEPVLSWVRGNQSTANVAMLVPLGLALPLAARGTRWRPWAFVALVAFPVLVEAAQRVLPVGRACDVGDVVDNWTGAAFGCLLGAAGARVRSERWPRPRNRR